MHVLVYINIIVYKKSPRKSIKVHLYFGFFLIEHWYRTSKAAPILVDWIVECIGHYTLLKLMPYSPCLSPQDFCAIGYPRELIEEDEEYSDNE